MKIRWHNSIFYRRFPCTTGTCLMTPPAFEDWLSKVALDTAMQNILSKEQLNVLPTNRIFLSRALPVSKTSVSQLLIYDLYNMFSLVFTGRKHEIFVFFSKLRNSSFVDININFIPSMRWYVFTRSVYDTVYQLTNEK